ncbi:unnamed protein product [Darwinula stevensoni]|uniref:Uncharacterized protein n=1 Tax=Darwinula stevensoni TaxID=69355 RepID=A0A7R9A173_9CRUS|nr:unnamed protein product [Darwinula stevensoni]CAG0887142.1 unnamed protein product [Darwinula stevensoni]
MALEWRRILLDIVVLAQDISIHSALKNVLVQGGMEPGVQETIYLFEKEQISRLRKGEELLKAPMSMGEKALLNWEHGIFTISIILGVLIALVLVTFTVKHIRLACREESFRNHFGGRVGNDRRELLATTDLSSSLGKIEESSIYRADV